VYFYGFIDLHKRSHMTEKEDLPITSTPRDRYKKAFEQGMQYEHYKIRKSRKVWFVRGLILGYLPYAIHQWPYIVQWVYS